MLDTGVYMNKLFHTCRRSNAHSHNTFSHPVPPHTRSFLSRVSTGEKSECEHLVTPINDFFLCQNCEKSLLVSFIGFAVSRNLPSLLYTCRHAISAFQKISRIHRHIHVQCTSSLVNENLLCVPRKYQKRRRFLKS